MTPIISITRVPCITRSPVRRPTLHAPQHPYRMRAGVFHNKNSPPLSTYPLRVPPPPLQRLARKTDRTIRVPPRAHLCLSCTRIERRREVSHVWPACSLRLTIPQTWAMVGEGRVRGGGGGGEGGERGEGAGGGTGWR